MIKRNYHLGYKNYDKLSLVISSFVDNDVFNNYKYCLKRSNIERGFEIKPSLELISSLGLLTFQFKSARETFNALSLTLLETRMPSTNQSSMKFIPLALN